tara:strand:- start:305 stop:466 length:162 start_codon:yes stop_codon:yes gene_type:complete
MQVAARRVTHNRRRSGKKEKKINNLSDKSLGEMRRALFTRRSVTSIDDEDVEK